MANLLEEFLKKQEQELNYLNSKEYNDYLNQLSEHEEGLHSYNKNFLELLSMDWSASDKLANIPTDSTNAILESILKFESSDRAKRHLNPGAIIYSDNLSEKMYDIYGIEFMKGDKFKGADNRTYYTADFNNADDAMFVTRYVISNLLKKSKGNIEQFTSWYTGLPKTNVIVQNYSKDIKKNLNK